MGRGRGGGGRSGRSRGAGGSGGVSAAAQSADLFQQIRSRPATPVEQLSSGDVVLIGANAARFDRMTANEVYLTRLNLDGSQGNRLVLPRFEGQRANRITPTELNRAISIASQTGGFSYNPLSGLNAAIAGVLNSR